MLSGSIDYVFQVEKVTLRYDISLKRSQISLSLNIELKPSNEKLAKANLNSMKNKDYVNKKITE